jgi:hypothetical protein
MTKASMQASINNLYRILSKRATENVLLHRIVERQRAELRRHRRSDRGGA